MATGQVLAFLRRHKHPSLLSLWGQKSRALLHPGGEWTPSSVWLSWQRAWWSHSAAWASVCVCTRVLCTLIHVLQVYCACKTHEVVNRFDPARLVFPNEGNNAKSHDLTVLHGKVTWLDHIVMWLNGIVMWSDKLTGWGRWRVPCLPSLWQRAREHSHYWHTLPDRQDRSSGRNGGEPTAQHPLNISTPWQTTQQVIVSSHRVWVMQVAKCIIILSDWPAKVKVQWCVRIEKFTFNNGSTSFLSSAATAWWPSG